MKKKYRGKNGAEKKSCDHRIRRGYANREYGSGILDKRQKRNRRNWRNYRI